MMSPSTQKPPVSLIVPVWGDDMLVAELVRRFSGTPVMAEWIVAAVEPGMSLRHLHREGHIRLVECPHPSRGSQMNAGAAVARGELLCFHHADSELTCEHLTALERAARDDSLIGGAFHRRFDDRHPWMVGWEKIVHCLDTGFGPLFGDQSIFVRRDVFRHLGGFADIPIMEDLEFSGRLRGVGRVRLLHPPILSSPRRFRRMGNWKTTLLNGTLIGLFYAGVSPARLHRWYYRHHSKPSGDGINSAMAVSGGE